MLPLIPLPVNSMVPCITSLWRFSKAALPPETSTQRSRIVSALGRASSAQNSGTEVNRSARTSLFMVDLRVSFRVPHATRPRPVEGRLNDHSSRLLNRGGEYFFHRQVRAAAGCEILLIAAV